MVLSISPRKIVVDHMTAAVPERSDEILALWDKYDPSVFVVRNAKGITLNATKERINFDAKTMEVFWLIGFNGWRAIECYSPHVILSASTRMSIEAIIQKDEGLADVELLYRERSAVAQKLIETTNISDALWPPDLPRPNARRDAFNDVQYKAAYDLTILAVGFTLFHEFRHVMLDRNNERHEDLREEELACDVWAREFMTVKLAEYARDHDHVYQDVLRKRSMGFALAALIVHEITPFWDHGGSKAYFSVATRLRTILDNTPLHDNDHFWVLAASLLIGIFRKTGREITVMPMDPRPLTFHLLELL